MKCPTTDQLSDYSLGKLDEECLDAIGKHIDDCSECLENLRGIESDDPLVHMLSPAGTDEPEFVGAVTAIQNLVVPRPLDLKLGDRLDEYRLVRLIGAGGMGVVYEAVHERLGKTVALKTMVPRSGSLAEATERFEREMRAVGKLDHPNIVRATDARDVDGVLVLAMDYVDGFDLQLITRRLKPLGIADCCEMIRQTAKGLSYAHQHQLVHRDVKPHNLMVSRDGQVKLLDLGLSRLLEDSDGQLTGDSRMLGTLDFVAPEQANSAADVDTRSDIYSLGCTLYYLLTGEAPFQAEKTPVQKVMAHANRDPDPLADHRSDCPEELQSIVSRMMAKQRSQRFQNADEIADALAPLSNGADLTQLVASIDGAVVGSHATVETISMDAATTHVTPVPNPSPVAPVVNAQRKASVPLKPLLIGLGAFAILLAVISVSLQTPNGTLVVEAEESIALAIEEQKIKIRDLQEDREFDVSVGETPLKPGTYEIQVADSSGLNFSGGTQFVISSNEREVVKVTLQPDATIPNVVIDKNDVQLQVLKWVVDNSGFVTVAVGDEWRVLDSLSDLPTSYQIVEIWRLKRMGDRSGLSLLPQLPKLRWVDIGQVPLVDAEVAVLAQCRQLEDLNLYGRGITDAGARMLTEAPRLRNLTLWDTSITDAGIKFLCQKASLHNLHLRANAALTTSAMQTLGESTSLGAIAVWDQPLTAAGLRAFSGNTKVDSLGVWNTGLDDEGMKLIAAMPKLTELNLSEAKITDQGIGYLTTSDLTRLEIHSRELTDACCQSLEQMTKLQSLHVADTRLSPSAVESLAKSIPKCEIVYSKDGKLTTIEPKPSAK